MKKKIMALILSSSFLTLPVFSASVHNIDEVTEVISQMLQTSADQFLTNQYGYSPRVFEEVKRNTQLLLTDKVFVRYLVE